jgi:DNA-binding SARP family transcriptional activator/predicted ATPase
MRILSTVVSAPRAPIRLFGGLAAGEQRLHLATTSGRLLALLASRHNERVWIDEIAEVIWPNGPPTSYRKAIQVAVFKLRTAINPHRQIDGGDVDLLIAHRDSYELRCSPDDIDATHFEQNVRSGMQQLARGDVDIARTSLQHAAATWAEPFGGEDAPFLTGWVEHLRASRRVAASAILEIDVRLGREDIESLSLAIAEEPYDERRWGMLMIALYRRGRQAEALQTFRDARQLLGEELGLEPGPYLRQIEQEILLQEGSLLSSSAHSAVPVDRQWPSPPVVRNLLLRKSEVAAIRTQLSVLRMMTIIGPPGVGKTTIAAEVARDWESTPCAWASLGDILPSPGCVYEVAIRLGVVTERSLDDGLFAEAAADLIGDRPLLVVLDNVEHLTASIAPFIDALLRSCPNLILLATSRRAIGSVNERTYQLSPFGVDPPPSGPDGWPQLSKSGQFLAQRRASAEVDLAPSDIEALNAIGRHLGGLAVGLEQAAVQMNRLSAGELAARLHLLDQEEHAASLRTSIEWSLGLLDMPELDLLSALALLESAFDLTRAEVIGCHLGFTTSVVDNIVSMLVDNSLVVDGVEVKGRRQIIEPIRSHIRTRVPRSPATERHRAACAHAIVNEAEVARVLLEGADQRRGIDDLRRLMPDVRSAIGAAVEAGDPLTVGRLLAALRVWWWASGTYADGQNLHQIGSATLVDWAPATPRDHGIRLRALSARALTTPGFSAPAAHLDDLISLAETARAFGSDADVSWITQLVAAGLAFMNHDPEQSEQYAKEALIRARRAGDSWLTGWAQYAAAISRARLDPAVGLELMEQSIVSFTIAGDLLSAARVTMFRAHGLRIFGVTDDTDESLRQARDWCAAAGAAPVTQLDCELGLAQNAHCAGREAVAADMYRALIPRLRELGDDRCAAVAQRSLASILAHQGDLDGANALVLRASEGLRSLASEDTELASTYIVRADIAIARGNVEFAVKLIARARVLAAGSGVPVELQEVNRIAELSEVLRNKVGSARFDALAGMAEVDGDL